MRNRGRTRFRTRSPIVIVLIVVKIVVFGSVCAMAGDGREGSGGCCGLDQNPKKLKRGGTEEEEY